jgi:hypothetical protein
MEQYLSGYHNGSSKILVCSVGQHPFDRCCWSRRATRRLCLFGQHSRPELRFLAGVVTRLGPYAGSEKKAWALKGKIVKAHFLKGRSCAQAYTLAGGASCPLEAEG